MTTDDPNDLSLVGSALHSSHAVDGDGVFLITATAATDQQWRRAHGAQGASKYFPKIQKYFGVKSILLRFWSRRIRYQMSDPLAGFGEGLVREEI